MPQKIEDRCCRCGRELQEFDGETGICAVHGWVSAKGANSQAKADKRRKEAEKQRKEAERQRRIEQRKRALHKAVAVIAALAAIVAAAVFFVVRPSVNYSAATNKFMNGEYESAKDEFSALGDYKDSKERALLCDVLIDLQAGSSEEAVAKLSQLTGEGKEETINQLASSLLPVMSDWKQRQLTPEVLLFLLSRTDIIDPSGTLDTERLAEEGHIALLDGDQLSAYSNDINDDGSAELIVLNPDYSVSVYRMVADGNIRLAVDNETSVACLMAFGEQYRETDVNVSVNCFSEALRLLPNDDTRSALTASYLLRSAGYENAGDMKAAIADARSAMEIAGTADAFAYFYDLNLRNCKNGHDSTEAIAMWDDFAEDAAAELIRYSAKRRWEADAAQMHITRASELAARKDEGCIAEIRIAAEMGADVADIIAEAVSNFEIGMSLARLRLMEIELCGSDEAKARQIRSNMAGEVRTAISEWKSRGISPADVPALIHLSDEQGIDLNGIDRDAVYEAAALTFAGNVLQHTFVDWNTDGYKELLTLDASGKLCLYGMDNVWKIVSSIDTRMPDPSYNICDEGAPLILVLSSGRDELLAVAGNDYRLGTLFHETGISRYKADGSVITYSKLLDGSIVRYSDYTYEAVDTDNRPVRTGIDWQQNDYPQPTTATEAITRYFEARAYDIPDEVSILTRDTSDGSLFTMEELAALPIPDILGTVDAVSYLTLEDQELFEVNYPSGTQRVRAWIATRNLDGWKLTGAAANLEAGLSASDIDFSISLVSLNSEIVNTIPSKGGRMTYRLLIPSAGRINLLWQSGSKATSRTSHTVTMIRGKLTGDVVFSYELQPSPNRQQSRDEFVSAGVYYVTVEANIKDAEQYHMTISFAPQAHVELENNDIPARATTVQFDTGYSGTLSGAKDVDYYAFTLDATSAVNVIFALSGNGGKSTTHTLMVLSAADGGKLCAVGVPGNAPLTETGNLYLSPGTYLVQVAKGVSYTKDEYILTVKVGQNGNMESEPNNTSDTANAIPINQDIHASTGQEGDIDCYTFTLDGDAIIQPRFTFTPTDSASKTYVLSILDANRQLMLKVNIGGRESTKVISPVALTAGTYTVKIENPNFVRQDYTLRLVSMAVDHAEKEPNDSAALAAHMAVGQSHTGILTTDADIDYYRVTFDRDTTVTLRFAFAQSTNRNTAFVLSVEQNGKTQWNANLKGDSGGHEWRLQFPAGDYYIRVKPSTWLGAVYTITLE